MGLSDYYKRMLTRRKELKMSQADLAEKTGLSLSSIRRYESGDRQPRTDDIEKISTALEINPDELMYGRVLADVNRIAQGDVRKIMLDRIKNKELTQAEDKMSNILIEIFRALNVAGQRLLLQDAQKYLSCEALQKGADQYLGYNKDEMAAFTKNISTMSTNDKQIAVDIVSNAIDKMLEELARVTQDDSISKRD